MNNYSILLSNSQLVFQFTWLSKIFITSFKLEPKTRSIIPARDTEYCVSQS